MSNTTLELSWSWILMSSPSFTSTPTRRCGTSGRTIKLDRTSVIPSRPSVLVGSGINRNRIRCSATYILAPSPVSIATAVHEVARGPGAAVLTIGTANPATCLLQEEYADWYFRVTKRDHLTNLKAKMNKICHKSGINKRYFHHTEETLLEHPELVDRALPSLHARQSVLSTAVPELAAAAAARAVVEWGRPAADITHVVVATNAGAHMPGADLRLAKLLGLRPSAQRTMMYLTGCHAGAAALRVATDIAENSPGATRVLVACADLSLAMFRAPHEDHPETLIMQALFGDGAAAVIVGAGTGVGSGAGAVERPLFEMVSASQTVVPDSEDAAAGQVGEGGLVFSPSPKMPALVREHIEQCLADAVAPLGLLGGGHGGGSWNDLFWAVHPGGPAILDSVQAALGLAPSKLAASRHVLSEYGNMSGASVIFVLDELRRRRGELDDHDADFGIMLGLGPGLTVEAMALRVASAVTKKVFQHGSSNQN